LENNKYVKNRSKSHYSKIVDYLYLFMLELKPRAMFMLGRHSAFELYPQPYIALLLIMK
jgi:hypothetical protein